MAFNRKSDEAAAYYNLRDLSALVVDDNQHILDLVAGILESFGMKSVHKVTDVDSAIALLRDVPVDLIITDWAMKPIEGIDLVRRIRSDGRICDPKVPIIMLTAHTEMSRVIEARDAGVTDFLAKPVTPRSLYERIVSLIVSPRPFLKTMDYFGPDRRQRIRPFAGPDRRKDAFSDTDDSEQT